MNKKDAIFFAGLMEDFLNIPSFVCEMIENKLVNEEYKDVIDYIIERKKSMIEGTATMPKDILEEDDVDE